MREKKRPQVEPHIPGATEDTAEAAPEGAGAAGGRWCVEPPGAAGPDRALARDGAPEPRRREVRAVHYDRVEAARLHVEKPQPGRARPAGDARPAVNRDFGARVEPDTAAVEQDRRIAGAALDCFAQEPVTSPSRFADLENVLLAPHSIAWTEELFRDIGRATFQVMIDLSSGKRPHGVLNPAVLARPNFQTKWRPNPHPEIT